jgi:hypothetical protein
LFGRHACTPLPADVVVEELSFAPQAPTTFFQHFVGNACSLEPQRPRRLFL